MDGFDIVAACGYISREFIQICLIYTHPLKLLAAFGGHEESLRSHLTLYMQ